jgi:hypothetical protein
MVNTAYLPAFQAEIRAQAHIGNSIVEKLVLLSKIKPDGNLYLRERVCPSPFRPVT